jgi:hypothetical protein
MGLTFDLLGHQVTRLESILYLAASGLVCFALTVVVLNRRQTRK